MKCYHHPDRDSVAVCTECGRGLCKEYASFYAKPFCPECAVSKALRIKQNLEKACLLFVALAVVFLIAIVTSYMPEVPPIHVLVSALFLACISFGWYKLTEFTPRGFLLLPVIGWLFYFFVKVVVSACIGPLALFFRSASYSCLRGLPWKKAGSNACDYGKGRGAALPFSCDKLLRQNPFKIVSSAPGMLRIGRPRSCRWGGRPAAICPAPQSERQRVCFFHAAYQIIATQMRGSLSLFLRNCGMLTRKGNTGKDVRNNDQYF